MKIENRGEFYLAFRELERLMIHGHPVPDLAWQDKLAEAVEEYELVHFPIGRPDKVVCPSCHEAGEPVLNKAGDDIACAKCGAELTIGGRVL